MVSFSSRELAFYINRDLLRQIAVRDRCRHGRNVTDLRRQIAGHRVHVVGEILPGAGDALHLRLTAEFPFRANLARHTRHFRSERPKLIDHRIHRLGGAQKLALQLPPFDVDRHRLRQIAFRDRADHTRHFTRRMNEIGDQLVDRAD